MHMCVCVCTDAYVEPAGCALVAVAERTDWRGALSNCEEMRERNGRAGCDRQRPQLSSAQAHPSRHLHMHMHMHMYMYMHMNMYMHTSSAQAHSSRHLRGEGESESEGEGEGEGERWG